MVYTIGQVVSSKAGRDKGECFVVSSVEEPFVYLVDGKLRKTDKPKKKKMKHIKPTNWISQLYIGKIQEKGRVSNSDVRKAIEEFINDCNN